MLSRDTFLPKKNLFLLITSIALVGVGGGACSSSSASAPAEPPDPNVYATGICNYFARCQPAFVRAEFGDVATCASSYLAPATALLNSGGAAISKKLLDACIARTESATCSDDIESLAECDFKGTLPSGAACASGVQCASGSCFKTVGADGSGSLADCGVCSARVAIGGDCSNAACAPNLQCVANQCAAVGEAGASCGDTQLCKTGLLCASNSTCIVPQKVGAPCDAATALCDSAQGLTCANGVCAAVVVKTGESCARYAFCEKSICSANQCTPYVPQGGGCTKSAECAFPLECRSNSCAESDPSACR